MKLNFLALLVIIISFTSFAQDKQQIKNNKNQVTTLYFIRHAEKDRTDKTNKDPHLTDTGQARGTSHVTPCRH